MTQFKGYTRRHNCIFIVLHKYMIFNVTSNGKKINLNKLQFV